jgi:undecaprenyl-diphosphatase
MIVTGIAFLAIEYFYAEKEHLTDDLDRVSLRQAVYIGLFQVLALIPGVSRSGTTILGALLIGLKRDVAIGFSFLLAIPTMGAASGYMLFKELDSLSFEDSGILAVGFVVSFAVGWIAVTTFLAIISRYSFKPFGLYLIVSGILFGLFGVELP